MLPTSPASTKTVLGITGPLSSGITTIAGYLSDQGFVLKRLSDVIRKELAKEGKELTAKSLQDKGDELRQKNNKAYLIKAIIEDFSDPPPEKIAFIGLRNPGEVVFLRKHFNNSFLIAIDCEREERLKRYRKKYKSKISDQDFYAIDDRDSGKEQPDYGQDVSGCVDLADYQIMNNANWEGNLSEIQGLLFKKVETFLTLIKKAGSGLPSMMEFGMHLAYSASLLSPCLKRQVGATITRKIDMGKEVGKSIIRQETPDKPGQQTQHAVAIGYNHPPGDLKTCLERFGGCYRDRTKGELKREFAEAVKGEIPADKIDFASEKFLTNPKVKMLDLCQAIHAEESAILQAAKLGGSSLRDTAIYTTTFPCMLCAKKIIETGISRLIYNEAYPVIEARDLLRDTLGLENVIRFEGVKSVAFFKLFQQNRKEREGE